MSWIYLNVDKTIAQSMKIVKSGYKDFFKYWLFWGVNLGLISIFLYFVFWAFSHFILEK